MSLARSPNSHLKPPLGLCSYNWSARVSLEFSEMPKRNSSWGFKPWCLHRGFVCLFVYFLALDKTWILSKDTGFLAALSKSALILQYILRPDGNTGKPLALCCPDLKQHPFYPSFPNSWELYHMAIYPIYPTLSMSSLISVQPQLWSHTIPVNWASVFACLRGISNINLLFPSPKLF